jgi:hypothetical protein
MNKDRIRTQPQQPIRSGSPPRGGGQTGLPLAVRLVLSLLLIWHVLAVFMAPFSIPPSSFLARTIAQDSFMQKYLDLLYLNHGYHFFAPDPGPGHLIRYQVVDERGQTIVQGEFPNLEDEWPRLRYHRHFMLTDQLLMPFPNEREAERFAQNRMNAYARHLLRAYDGYEARLTLVRHDLLSPRERLNDVPLNASHKYITVTQAVQTRRDLERYDAADAQVETNSSGGIR